MKELLKIVTGTVIGLFAYGIIQFVLVMLCIVGMALGSSNNVEISKNSVLVLNLSGDIKDHSEQNPIYALIGQNDESYSLRQISKAIKAAKTNDKIKGIYIEAGALQADPATLTALRDVLKDFKSSKKWIIAYADQYSQGSYYVSSIADKVWINPYGMLSWHGIGSQPQYLKDFLSKFGVRMQVVKVGQYKSATETYSEDHMSDANREQVTRYITGIWERMVADVSESRNIKKDSLQAYADQVMEFESTSALKSKKLIDAVYYADEAKAEIKKKLEIDEDEAICQVNVKTMNEASTDNGNNDETVAVYFCEGSIVQQPIQGAAMGDAGIIGNNVCKDLEDLEKDDDIKAVVIRINSGGGDAYASEQMWHAISKLKKKKPVVVSMGGMAASGGYYMGCNASWIVAEPTTITGSIGIFGTFPDASELITQKLGIKYDEVKTNKHSTMSMFAMARPFNADEIELLQKYIDRGYELFRKRVADGRKLKISEVEKIAQGHVWLGEDAIKIKLVDQLGNIDDAINKAAALAKLNDYAVKDYPVEMDFMSQLLQNIEEGNYLDEKFRLMLGEYYSPFMYIRTINQQNPVQARIPFILKIN